MAAMHRRSPFALGLGAALALCVSVITTACSSTTADDAEKPQASVETQVAALKGYAAVVKANYDDALAGMKDLQSAIADFVAAPSEATLEAARAAYVRARPIYSQTEVYRFYGGPIDADDTGPEGRINGWPLDEAYVDYTKDDAAAGIINRPTEFPTITKDVIKNLNEKGGEKNLSAGWHAIEFLLWGQDLSATGPGARPFTDFVDGGTASNQKRRREYLVAVTDLMVDDFTPVAAAWNLADATSYGSKFVALDPKAALTNVLKGIGSLSGAELSKERMNNAYETRDQEEEHDCFSDTTTNDLVGNALGLENAYLGRYVTAAGVTVDGTGIDELVKFVDADLDTQVKTDLAAALAAVKSIPAPFDQAIVGDDSAPGRKAIRASMDSLATVTASIVKVATALEVTINIE